MDIASIGIEKIAKLICDDTAKYKYRTKEELKNLFYGNVNDINLDDENLTRKKLTIEALNNIKSLEKLLKNICDNRNFETKLDQQNFINELNEILVIDKIIIKKKEKTEEVYIENLNKSNIIKSELISKEILSIEYINEQIGKASEKILKKDYSGAITNTRTLLEQIIRDLCTHVGIEYQENNIKKNFDELRKKINLNPDNYQESGFKKIVSGIINSVDGIFEVRNKCSDSHSRKYNPNKHHARLCINGVLTVSEFLVESYLYQKRKGKI